MFFKTFTFSYLKLTFSKVISESNDCFDIGSAISFIEDFESKISRTLSAAALPFLIEYEALLIAYAGVKTP